MEWLSEGWSYSLAWKSQLYVEWYDDRPVQPTIVWLDREINKLIKMRISLEYSRQIATILNRYVIMKESESEKSKRSMTRSITSPNEKNINKIINARRGVEESNLFFHSSGGERILVFPRLSFLSLTTRQRRHHRPSQRKHTQTQTKT